MQTLLPVIKLTHMQGLVMGCLKRGMTRKEVAGHLKISISSVRLHRDAAVLKTGALNVIGALGVLNGTLKRHEDADLRQWYLLKGTKFWKDLAELKKIMARKKF